MTPLRAVMGTAGVPALLGTSFLGRLPTAMATLAVLLLVRGEGGGYTLAATLAALVTVGTAIGQPLLSRLVDRRGQRLPLLAAGVVSTVAFVVVGVVGTSAPVASGAAALVAGLATPPLEPCLRSLWPHVVPEGPVLRAAFNLDVGAQELIFVLGPVLVTASVALGGHRAGLVACAVFGLAGTLAFASRRASLAWRPAPVLGAPHGSPLRHGVLVRAFVVSLALGAPVGALPIAAAAFAARHHASALTGWTLAANAAGALAAGLYGATHRAPRPTAFALSASGVALAVGYLPLALPAPPALWLVLAAVSGLALPVALSLAFQRVAAHSPANLITEANAWVATSFGVGASVAALLAGVVADRVAHPIPTMLVGAAVVTAVVSALSYRRVRA